MRQNNSLTVVCVRIDAVIILPVRAFHRIRPVKSIDKCLHGRWNGYPLLAIGTRSAHDVLTRRQAPLWLDDIDTPPG